ncbi:MAG TPA: hypothetical protein G4O02_03100 [Caldilineae bacterium]|nr:hypothetical protein [Caldilineae bacterium]
MGRGITYSQVIARLTESDIPHGVLALQNGVRVIISQRGGRILGPFLGEEGESIFWINPAFAAPDAFQAFLDSGDWNLGGERIWIAPEIQYHVRDRGDFWGSLSLPEQVDPGQYVLDQPRPEVWRLRQDMELKAFNLATGRKELHLERLIRSVPDPLREVSGYRELIDGVVYAGYEQIVTLSERQSDDIMSAAWALIQLNPGGELVIPASPCVEYADYFEPIDESLQTIHADHVRLKITGDRRYKVGYKAAHVFGRLAYFSHLDDGRGYLVIRNFWNNPSAPYPEEPPDRPGCRGFSIHVYNDGGDFGGFGEMECQGQTIGGPSGRSSATDSLVLWLYVGPDEKLREIATHLLGVEL